MRDRIEAYLPELHRVRSVFEEIFEFNRTTVIEQKTNVF